MPPAVRLTDVTAHGTPLTGGPGSADVLIGGMPAWRAGSDVHTCPVTMPSGAPHGPGVVATGSSTVLVNQQPAVRQGDVLVEGGPPNAIVSGEPTVIIDGGSTAAEPAWVTVLFAQLTEYVAAHNADVGEADLGTVVGQLTGEAVNLHVAADGGDAEFSFHTTDGGAIREFERGHRDDASLKMETDAATVERLSTAADPLGALRLAYDRGDVDVTGIGAWNGVKWWVIDGVSSLVGVS